MNKTQEKRLLNVARALRESPAPEKFTMSMLVHDFVEGKDPNGFCGTPACALGHYAARGDLQKLMKVQISFTKDDYSAEGGYTEAEIVYSGDKKNNYGQRLCGIDDDVVCEHFGIDEEDACELFEAGGCGGATTPKAAAKYIERFVARKLKAKSAGKLIRRNELY